MKKWNKLFILSIMILFSVKTLAEIKEIKLLEDITNEIIDEKPKTVNSKISKSLSKLEKKSEIKENSKKEVEELVKIERKVDKNSIVDTFEKKIKNGIAYRNDEIEPFTGIFGAIIDEKINHYENYTEGLLDGESAWFSREGIKLLSENYSKGKLDGEQKSYYENGKIKSIVKYINNRIDGIIAYDKNGEILHKSIFQNGTGKWKFYWSNGNISEEGSYVSWRKDGVWKKYREDGTLDTTRKYDKGKLLSERWE